MGRAGIVYVQNIMAGIIRETDEGYEFAYDPEYLEMNDAAPVSLTLPLKPEPYRSNSLFPFFDGLIPEGWLLGVVERNWKLDGNDRFGLMLVTCADCIGDVRIEAI
ncbi:MAG: HipA N-terminal domain-containing protein [Lachnospiraceae bacterium]|nr:HipA N-terminal domain-containing protein [Lachnospiraceae bacterium]